MKTYVNANGFEVEKFAKPYGAVPKKQGKSKREKHVRKDSIHETIRGQ